jgi:hypothetical protein
MGYPDGVKGYRVRDISTGAFFVARDVEFDEASPDHVNSDSDSDNNMSPTVKNPFPMVEIPHNFPSPIVLTPQPISSVRRSVRTKKLTEKGAAWTAELEVT